MMKGVGAAVVGILLVFMVAMNAVTVEAVFGIDMNPCTIISCTDACKNLLGDKFDSASCYQGIL
ncbi:hypothetical protein LINPERHAP2_LOCUS9921 [Linum perenne]